MVNAITLGQQLEDNLGGLVTQAQEIDTNAPNVLGKVLDLSQDAGKVEAANTGSMKAFKDYADAPKKGSQLL